MQRSYNSIAQATIIIVLLALVACTPTQQQAPQAQTIKIGALLSLSGPAAAYGESARQGIAMAVDDVNARGGIGGKRLEIVYEDDETDPSKAVGAFNKLVAVDNVSAIIGGTWDFNYNAIAPLAEQDKVTLITPQNPKTDGLIVNNYTFVMQPSLRHITAGLETYVREHNLTRIAVVHFASPYGQAVTQGMQDIADRTGGTLVLEETYSQLGGNDFLTTAAKIKDAHPDAVFIDMGTDGDVLTFAKRMRQVSPNTQVLGHRIIADTAETATGSDHELLEGMVYFDYTEAASSDFIAGYEKRYGVEPLRNADSAYESVIILADAFGHAAPQDANAYIESHSFDTLHGNISFKGHVVGAKEVLINQIVKNGTITLERKSIG